MSENISNNAVTSLVSAITNVQTSFGVHDASAFPAPNFRILCGSELMLCTGKSSNTLTVQRAIEGTTAAAHSANSTVACVLTAAGFRQYIDDAYATDITPEWDDITGKPAELDYVTGTTSAIQTQLDGKAPTSHTHTIANVTNLQTTLDGKANTTHTHGWADLVGSAQFISPGFGNVGTGTLSGQIRLGGTTGVYAGSAGQVIMSQGSSSATMWSFLSSANIIGLSNQVAECTGTTVSEWIIGSNSNTSGVLDTLSSNSPAYPIDGCYFAFNKNNRFGGSQVSSFSSLTAGTWIRIKTASGHVTTARIASTPGYSDPTYLVYLDTVSHNGIPMTDGETVTVERSIRPGVSRFAVTVDYGDVTNTPTLGTVATTNDYNSLDNLPPIPNVTDQPGDEGTYNLKINLGGGGEWVEATNFPELVWNETPSGTVDGSNDTFTLASSPASGKLMLFRNGILMREGGGNDFTTSASTIVFESGSIPASGAILLATYQT